MPGVSSGSVRLTGDGAVGTSGKPIRVFSVVALSGGSAGSVVLRNGTSASGTVYVQQTGPSASQTTVINFENGLRFPNGCFFDKDANIDAVVIEYRVEL